MVHGDWGPNYAPLGPQGILETPSGHILVGEYGNVATTVYRVRRSTDDGLTWSTVLASPGTDPDVLTPATSTP